MNTQFENIITPMHKFSELTTNNVEAVTSIYVDAIDKNTKLCIEALKGASEISDIESLRTFISNRVEVNQQAGKNFITNVQQIAGISKGYAGDVKLILEDTLACSLNKQDPVTTPSAKKTQTRKKTRTTKKAA